MFFWGGWFLLSILADTKLAYIAMNYSRFPWIFSLVGLFRASSIDFFFDFVGHNWSSPILTLLLSTHILTLLLSSIKSKTLFSTVSFFNLVRSELFSLVGLAKSTASSNFVFRVLITSTKASLLSNPTT